MIYALLIQFDKFYSLTLHMSYACLPFSRWNPYSARYHHCRFFLKKRFFL